MSPTGRQTSVRLSVIDEIAMLKAIEEYNDLGRAKFLKKYGFSKSSKFYLIHEKRLYDTKALVSAAYRRATGRRLAHDRFGGGAQTVAVFERLKKDANRFRQSKWFEDTLGELGNLSTEFDRLPRVQSHLQKLGFSKWIPFSKLIPFTKHAQLQLHTGWLPGVYVIAASASQPAQMRIIDQRIVYIGETVTQDLHKRLRQLHRSLEGKAGHGGGVRLRKKEFHRKKLWLSIRSFPLGYGLEDEFAQSFRSSQIRCLERTLLHEFVRSNQAYPPGNLK